MAKISLKSLKKASKVFPPVLKTVRWTVEATEDNIDFLKESTKLKEIELGEIIELEGEIFIKKLDYKSAKDAAKAYKWNINYEEIEKSKLESVDADQLQATRLIGSVCENAAGKPFFDSIEDVYSSEPSFITALYAIADEVNNFMGKSRTKNSTDTNSSANLSPAESVEEPSKKLKSD